MRLQALSDAVTPEFRGLGRMFQQKIGATADADDAQMDCFLAYVYGRAQADRLPRPDRLETEMVKLTAGDPFGRIIARAQLRKKEFVFHRARWTPSRLADPAWDGDEELGIGAMLTTSVVQKYKYKTASMVTYSINLCMISDQTLARWFRRAIGQTSHEELLDDLALVATLPLKRRLADGFDLAIADFVPEHVSIPTPHGSWRGVLEPLRNSENRLDLCLNVRTFI